MHIFDRRVSTLGFKAMARSNEEFFSQSQKRFAPLSGLSEEDEEPIWFRCNMLIVKLFSDFLNCLCIVLYVLYD